MRKFIFVNILLFSLSLSSYNQYFTVEDIETGRRSYLMPDDLENLQWSYSGENVIFSKGDSLFEINATGSDKQILLNLNQLNEILLQHKRNVLNELPVIEVISEHSFSFSDSTGLYVFDLEKKDFERIFALSVNSENITLSPNAKIVCFTINNNVWIQDEKGIEFQLTYDSIDGITNGGIVYRNEFGIENGIYWSPQSNYLAFYRKDETQISKYPIIDVSSRVAATEFIRYPMAGLKSEETEVSVFSVSDHSFIRLKTEGDAEQYLTNLSWTPDEKTIYIQHLNRSQDTMVLKSYNAKTGAFISELFSETDDKYVEPLNQLVFSEISSGDFFYQSNKDGFNHIYYYNAGKGILEGITQGNWEVTDFLGFDDSERNVYFMATKDSPLENHCYMVSRDNGEIIKLSIQEGSHKVIFNSDMTYFIDRFSSYTVANTIVICRNSGELVYELLKSDNPVIDYELGELEIGNLLAADDSTELYYRIVKPPDFDPGKKYPVLVYVYGGPHVQLITNSWMDRIEYFQQYMAQNGFVSFTIDSRGSASRGKEFENVIHKQLGIPQLEDQMEGIEFIKSLSYVDTSRLGVHGWSFGGYMAISMMLKYPEIFKVGVAGGPVIDWKYYEIMYTERYMDKPSENPDGYKLTDLKNYAGNLSGDLLIIHGVQDPVVAWQQSLLFLQACIESDVIVDYFVYPKHEHNVVGKDRVHLTTLISEYFIKRLKSGR